MNTILARLNRHVAEIVRGASLALILKVIAAGSAFLVNIVLARILGSDGIGIYFLSLSVITFSSLLGRMGTDNLVLREVAKEAACKHWNSVRSRHIECLKLLSLASIPVTIIIAVFADAIAITLFSKPGLATPLRIMSIAIIPMSLFNLYANSLKGLKKVKEAVAVQNVFLPVFTLVFLFALIASQNVISASSAYVAAVVLTAVVGGVLWKKAVSDKPKYQKREDRSASLIASARHMLVIAMLTFAMKWLSTIFLGIWGTSSEIGIFNIAQRTALLTSFILVAVNTISAPKFAELYQKGDMQGLQESAVNSARLLMFASLPMLLLFLVLPDWVMGLFGSDFGEGGVILTILALGQFVNVVTGSVAYLLMMTGNERFMMTTMLYSAAIGFIMNLILVPVLGGLGAAIATAVAMAVQNIIAAIWVHEKLGISTLPFDRLLFNKKGSIR